ncbi:transcriptional regulator [Neobacillus bataviensis LMG 21833]|uniref:Transcriptional regulator n=1 Tax=Neobacillus bataviensis LMG 21833 TaxID=1117379 RepID=K6E096_9BACI|nr:helix-turn-helix domain-containing protein [Neobacillus bataviensis]EKN66561.1 transcriptional regulator [Neobacillus bataviensis LMG 21833]
MKAETNLHHLDRETLKVQQEMEILMESFRVITSSLELDDVLKKIMRYASAIFRSTDAGYILLFDKNSEKLIVKSYIGFNDQIRSFRVGVGESIVGKVFRDGCVRLIGTTKEIYENMTDLSEENHTILQAAAVSTRKIKSLLSVPIMFGDIRIGVMTLHRFEREKLPSERDLLLLESFASHVAVAIHNAQLHEDVQKSLGEVTHLLTKLEETNQLLQQRTEIHNHLTRLSIENRGLTSIIMEMDHLMEKGVFYADYIEGKCYPSDNLPYEKIIADLFLLFINKTNPAYVSISKDVNLSFYVYPIRSGSVFLGCLIIVGDDPLSMTDRLIVEQGAPILTLEIIKIRSKTDILYRKTFENYHEFLKIKNPFQAELAVKELGIETQSFIQTVVIEMSGNVDQDALENETRSLLTRLNRNLPAENRLISSYNNKIILFSTTSHEREQAKLIELIEKNIERWNKMFTVAARAGVSTGLYYPGQAEDNHNKAEQALLHLKKQSKNGVFHFREIGIARLFLNHQSSEIESFLAETFSLLWTDQEKYQDLLATLISYVQHNRSMVSTAKALHIHTNTLYHRIKKIEDLIGADYDNFEDYLRVQLAVYLYNVFYLQS